MPSAASAMSGEWAATLTGSSMARFAPSAFAMPSAASTAARSPETTTWPGELRFATPKTPCSPACATSSGRRASSRPMMAAIRPSRPAPDDCISWPRVRTRRTASSRSRAPAATRAVYWPIEWPAAKAGSGMSTPSCVPALPHGREVGDRGGEEGGLGVLGAVQVLLGALPGEAADGLAEGGVGGGEDGGGRGRGLGEGAAHADELAALAGKDEGDLVHRCAA